MRFPEAAYADDDFVAATDLRGRIFNVHVRRATMGDLALENTHPFALGPYTFGHNGTVLRYPRLLEPGVRAPARRHGLASTLFNLLMHDYDPGDPIECLRRAIATAVARSPFSGLNLLFSDGERLFAYRLGLFELHWLARPGQLLVASERVTDEPWHTVQQDVLLVLDPDDLEEPHAERLLGDERVAHARIQKVDHTPHLRGAERGAGGRRARTRSSSGGRRVSRGFALLVNPASGGGALRALPAVHTELDALGAEHRTVTTRSIEHAGEEARRPRQAVRPWWRSAATACCGRSPARSGARTAPWR